MDIPNNLINDSIIAYLGDEVSRAKENGIKVVIRTESKNNNLHELKRYSIEYNNALDPIVIIDKKIVWYGIPYSDAKFISEDKYIDTKLYPIFRFNGSIFARTIYSMLEMKKSIDQSREKDYDEEGNIITDTFQSFIKAKVKCEECGNNMVIKKTVKNRFFLSCSQYPYCKYSRNIDDLELNVYLIEKNKRCRICGSCLEARSGKYGPYIKCSTCNSRKIYNLDEI